MGYDKAKQRALIDACNLLCDHVSESLPEGWSIQLAMNGGGGDADLTMHNPDGEEVEIPTTDYNDSMIDAACRDAVERSSTS